VTISLKVFATGAALCLAFTIAACGSDEAGSDVPGFSEAPDVSAITVEATKLTYLPDQTGGKFHTASVLLRNTSDQVAVDVGGQLSLLNASGELIESVTPSPVTILPGELGLLTEEALDLPVAVEKGSIEVDLSVDSFVPPPKQPPVTFSKVKFERGTEESFGLCKVRGTVMNTFTKPQTDLQLQVATFKKGKFTGGGSTYIDQVFPGRGATFKVEFISPSECSDSVDRIEVMSNLGLDKITDP